MNMQDKVSLLNICIETPQLKKTCYRSSAGAIYPVYERAGRRGGGGPLPPRPSGEAGPQRGQAAGGLHAAGPHSCGCSWLRVTLGYSAGADFNNLIPSVQLGDICILVT